jgi:repressor LexA
MVMRTRKKLSIKQERILAFIYKVMTNNVLPPTVRDIQKACALSSTSVVNYNLRILQMQGHLRRHPDVARGIELLDKSGNSINSLPQVPVMGYISAGEPLPGPSNDGWTDDPIETIEVPRHLMKPGKTLYALKVKGRSMIDAFIDDGDLILLEKTSQAKNGDMVAAWLILEQEATLKRFYQEGPKVRLQPENSSMKPIFTDASNMEIHGKVAAVLRTL